jgi:hypothetical protein
MKSKFFIFGLMVSLVVLAACGSGGHETASHKKVAQRAGEARPATAAEPPAKEFTSASQPAGHEGHSHGAPGEVPAFQISPAALKSLPPTLSPESFTGKQRLGYQAAKAIPKTIAQLPCYCHCDKGFGHKSLHSCFVDDHAAHCAICIDEALMALKLEKQEKLSPEQIRERIIAQYSEKQ